MTDPNVKFAQLDKARLAKLQALEDELGTYVVALEPEVQMATLSQEQVKRLQEVENELDVIMLAYAK